MPAIALDLQWMDSAARHLDGFDPYPWSSSPSWSWAVHARNLLAPQVHVNGRMALLVLAIVLWAFSWLLFRAYIVLHTPNDVLVEKLGLDIPPEPILLLEEIAARQFQISWKPEDSAISVQEYRVELNGKVIGTTKKSETAAIISNLNPGTCYDLRIFSISPGQFLTPSKTLGIRTNKTTESASSQDGTTDGNPVLRSFVPRVATIPTPSVMPTQQRDSNAALIAGRRGTNARKASPAGQPEAIPDPKEMDDEQGEDLADLSQQFSDINTDIDRIDSEINDEIAEFEAHKKEKETQRQTYLQEMRERDDQTNDLRKQVNRAEALARSLLNDKTKKEKQVKDKESRRQKRINEMASWDKSMQTMAEELEIINKQKDIERRKAESQVQEVKDKIAEEQAEIQQLEDENKDKAQQLKDLQEERRRNSVDEETEESKEADRRDHARDLQFRSLVASLSHEYNSRWQELQRQQQQHVLARQRATMFETQRRAAAAVQFVPMPTTVDADLARRNNAISRRARHAGSQGSNVSSPRALHAPEPFSSVGQIASSPLAPRSLFNVVSGMTMVESAPDLDDDDDDASLAAPMSPRADALLPTDLLGDDSEDELVPDDDPATRHGLFDDQTSPFPPFDPDQTQTLDKDKDRIRDSSPSPRSPSSPRSFASPNNDSAPDRDPDRRSVRSSHPPIPEDARADPPTHKRLTSMSNLFSFNRARGKTSSADQPPALGTLKSESQSFPRQMDEFDPTGQPRRRLSYGNNWAFPGGNFLGRQNDDEPDLAKPSITRRAFPNLLNGVGKSRTYDPFQTVRTNSLDPTGRAGSSSSRPGSVYSFDVVPRMSMDDGFGGPWRHERGMARNSPLVPDWASSYSRSHSRRPSVGFISQTNLAIGPDEGEFIEPKRDTRPLQAPIGTRPTSSQRPLTPKLNPNAPSFTMFKFGSKSKDKAADKSKPSESFTHSPPESRKSKDTHSIAPTTSTMESRESLERTTSFVSTTGASLESTPASKPTFMSKITRKASSNKFDWKSKSSSIFSSRKNPGEATTPTGDLDDEATGSSEQLTSSRSLENTQTLSSTPSDDKKGSRSSLGSWNFMRKKPKAAARDLTNSEISENGELVSESGNTTDHDFDERPLSSATSASKT